MGKEKHLTKIEQLFKKSPVVSYSSIERIVKHAKNTEYTKQLIRNLLLKDKIKRLTKGFYTLYDNPQLSVFCFKPAYFGLQDALSFHNLWEQETIPVIVTTRKIRQGIRKVLGMNVLVRRIEKKYYFGIDYVEQNGLYFPYSDIEKTVIDMIYFKERTSDEVIKNVKSKINKKKLILYLKKYPARLRKMVLKSIR